MGFAAREVGRELCAPKNWSIAEELTYLSRHLTMQEYSHTGGPDKMVV